MGLEDVRNLTGSEVEEIPIPDEELAAKVKKQPVLHYADTSMWSIKFHKISMPILHYADTSMWSIKFHKMISMPIRTRCGCYVNPERVINKQPALLLAVNSCRRCLRSLNGKVRQ